MQSVIHYFKTLPQRQIVRPWAMLTPVLVLVIALPLLRPLRRPELSAMSTNELSRLATVQAMAEQHTQAIDHTSFYPTLRYRTLGVPADSIQIDGKTYSDKAPVLSAILAGDYLLLRCFGLSMEHHGPLVVYLLTILCSVIPTAAVGGMVYRMGRLFELRRPLRALLALAVTFGSGLLSYAVVINAHAPAAALILGACACLVHVTVARQPPRTGAWFMASGLCAALAATIDPASIIFFVPLVLVIVAMRWKKRLRIGGVILYGVGAIPVVLFHAFLTVPITGDLLPPAFHPEMTREARLASSVSSSAADETVDEDAVTAPTWLRWTLQQGQRINGALLGSRGIFSHFPVLIFGVLGIGAILRRHWPIATKMLAGITIAGGALIIIVQPLMQREGSFTAHSSGGFGPRWFLIFLPLLLFWAGAWMRKRHHPITWTLAAVCLLFSVVVALLGTTAPFLVAPGRYGPSVALHQLMHPQTVQSIDLPSLADAK